MRKILFVNLDLLKITIQDVSYSQYRDKFVHYVNELCENQYANKIVFISRDTGALQLAKTKFVEKLGFKHFEFATRDEVKRYVVLNRCQNNYFVFVSGKEVDFHVAVNSQSLYIVPRWLPCEPKAEFYGVQVDTPEQFYMFIKTLNNQNSWFSTIHVDGITSCYSLMDGRYGRYAETANEKEMIINFENLLKRGTSRNYYEILMYHFLAGMTNSTLFDDIELFGMIPSSNCRLNPYIHKFMEQVRYIKRKRLPKNNMDYDNLLIRHTPKEKAHNIYSTSQRVNLGAEDEFSTLIINPEFSDKIDRLKSKNKFNVMIFDDYMTHGNTFNAVRNLLETLGANKIIFVSMGSFNSPFQKKDYRIIGSVYEPGYRYELYSQEVICNIQLQYQAKKEVDELYEIFNT